MTDPFAPFDLAAHCRDLLQSMNRVKASARCPHCHEGITAKVVSADDKRLYASVQPVLCPYCNREAK